MFCLTREVRFAINPEPDAQLRHKPANSFGGYPALTGLGAYYIARVTLAGDLDPTSHYLVNIKAIDEAVRRQLGAIEQIARAHRPPAELVEFLVTSLHEQFADRLHTVELALSPMMTLSCNRLEHPMLRLSQKFEFSASHRLFNPALSEEENRRTFGKCTNPHGHGHNYELQVTLLGPAGENGLLVDVPAFERIVAETVVERFDHKNLNTELPEFRDLIPTVENIAKMIFGLLKPRFADQPASLASVTVWETPKTWCEYSE